MLRKRVLYGLMLLLTVMIVACSSQIENDARAVSREILRAGSISEAEMCSTLSALDSLLMPEVFGRDFAMEIVQKIENDSSCDAKELNRRVKLLRKCITDKQGKHNSNLFVAGVQSYVETLSFERKMKLYAKIATPEQLGTALRVDRYRSPNDSARIKAEAEALMKIYNDAEKEAFLKHLNR